MWAQGKQGGSFQFDQRKLEKTIRDETEEGRRSTHTGLWRILDLSQEKERLKTRDRKYLICTVKRSIWMKNRLGGRGHKSESRRPLRRLLKDYWQGVRA